MEKYVEKFVAIADGMDLEIVDVTFASNDQMNIRLARKNFLSVDLDTCEKAHRAFGEAIDYEIALDVSSAGAERVIDPSQYDDLKGQYVLIKFKNPFSGADYVEGTIVAIDDNEITVSYQLMHRMKEVAIERENIAMLRLAVKV